MRVLFCLDVKGRFILQNISNITPNNTGCLRDDCDRASSIVGFDINKYVFGDSFQKTQAPNNAVPNNSKSSLNKNNNPLVAGVSLLCITAAAVALVKRGGGLSNSKFLNSIKQGVGNFIARFKKS